MSQNQRKRLTLAALTLMVSQTFAQTAPLQVIAQQPPGSGSDAMTRACSKHCGASRWRSRKR